MSYTPTQVGDLSLPVPVSDYMMANLPDVLGFLASGAATLQFGELASLGGNSFTMRRFAEDTGDAALDDGTSDAGAKLSPYADVAVITRRRRTRGVDNAIRAALGTAGANAVMDELTRQSAYYWTRRMETSLVNVLAGLFDSSAGVLRTTHRVVKGASTGVPVLFSYNAGVDACAKLGDNMDKLSLILFPSKVWADAKKEQAAKIDAKIITDETGAVVIGPDGQPTQARFYDGKRVVITDQVATSGSGANTVYRVLFVKPGALGLAFQRQVETRLGYLPQNNSDVLVQSAAYAAHTFGVKFSGTASSAQGGATDAELATPGNWTKVATNDKEIGITCLEVNATQ